MSFSVGRANEELRLLELPGWLLLDNGLHQELEFTDKTSRKACAGTPVLGVLKRGTGVEGASSSSICQHQVQVCKTIAGLLGHGLFDDANQASGSSGWNCVTGGGGSFTMR